MTKRVQLFRSFFVLNLCLLLQLSGCNYPAPQATPTPLTLEATNPSSVPMAEGHLVPRDSTWLSFFTSAKVAEVLVEEGQWVAEGTALASLGDREEIQAHLKTAEQSELEAREALEHLEESAALDQNQAWKAMLSAQSALMDAQEMLDRLDTTAYQDRIDRAWDKVQDEKENLEDAQTRFDKYKDLDEENYNRRYAEDRLEEAQNRYDQAVREYNRLVIAREQARAALAQAQAAVDDTQQRYDDLKEGPDPDTLAIYRARLANAQAQKAAAQAALDNMTLTAPYDGEITQVKISAGEQVAAGMPVIQIADFSEWYVETSDLNELEVVDIHVGQSVIIQPDALPGVELTGTVEKTASAYLEKSGDILYTVRIKVDKIDERLRWGMTVALVFGE